MAHRKVWKSVKNRQRNSICLLGEEVQTPKLSSKLNYHFMID